MARIPVTLDAPDRDGAAMTPITPTADGISFIGVPGKTVMIVDNTAGSGDVTVSLKIGKTVLGQTVTPFSVVVEDGAIKAISGFTNDYAQPLDSPRTHVDFSGTDLPGCAVYVLNAS